MEEKRQQKYEEELEDLEEMTKTTKEENKEIIKQIEAWSEATFKEIVFDSDVDNWAENISVFDKHVFGKEKLVFMIEDEENNVFGGYLNTKIDKYYEEKDWKWDGSSIYDKNAFVFSIYS